MKALRKQQEKDGVEIENMRTQINKYEVFLIITGATRYFH